MNLDAIMSNSLVLVPLILACVQGVKMIAPSLSRWSPLFAIGFGIGFAYLFYTGDVFNFKLVLTNGIMAGLSASGLYSGVKSTALSDGVDKDK